MKKIAVFCPNLVGDTVMATPAFRALARGFPEARICLVARPLLLPLFEGTSWFAEVITHDPRSARRSERMVGVIRRLRAERFELAVLFPNSFRSALTAWLAGIPRRIGYVLHGRSWLLTDRLYEPRDRRGARLPRPIVHSYLELVRRLGCPVGSTRLELAATPAEEELAIRAVEAVGLAGDRPLVVLNTGGAYGPAKSWPEQSFAVLARRLATERDLNVLVVCGPAEREPARRIASLANHERVASLADQTLSLSLTKACVKRACLVVTTDSGPRHFAAAFGTPVVTLFGPTHIAWTRTHHPHALHVYNPVSCGPCQRPACPEGHHRCLRELEPAQVFEAANRLLGPVFPRSRAF